MVIVKKIPNELRNQKSKTGPKILDINCSLVFDHLSQEQKVHTAPGYGIVLEAVQRWARINKKLPFLDPKESCRSDSPTNYPEKEKS